MLTKNIFIITSLAIILVCSVSCSKGDNSASQTQPQTELNESGFPPVSHLDADCAERGGSWNSDSNTCTEAPFDADQVCKDIGAEGVSKGLCININEDNMSASMRSAKQSCSDSNGRWHQPTQYGLGIPNTAFKPYCEPPANDSGKSCTDTSECKKYCAAASDETHGQCAAFDYVSGSYWFQGKLIQMMVD